MLLKETKAKVDQAREATCHPWYRPDPDLLHEQENIRRPKIFYSDWQHYQPAAICLQKAASPSLFVRAPENERLYRDCRVYGRYSGICWSSARQDRPPQNYPISILQTRLHIQQIRSDTLKGSIIRLETGLKAKKIEFKVTQDFKKARKDPKGRRHASWGPRKGLWGLQFWIGFWWWDERRWPEQSYNDRWLFINLQKFQE